MATTDYTMGDAIVREDAVLAGWWKRVGATLIDFLVVAVPLLIVGVVLGLSAGEGEIFFTYALSAVTALIYAPLLMARGGAHNGQTWGKQVTGIRVVREDGNPMDFSRGLVRDGVGKGVLSFVPLYGLVDSLCPLGDSRKQAIHDKIGSTTVQDA